MYVCIRFHNYLCTHFPEDKMKSSRTGRGQLFEVEAKDKSSRPRTKFWPRGQLGLEDLTSLVINWRYVALVVVLWCPALSSFVVCNRPQMRTSECRPTCLIFGVSIGLDPG